MSSEEEMQHRAGLLPSPQHPPGTIDVSLSRAVLRRNLRAVGEVREGAGGIGSAESRVEARRECVRQLREVHREGPQEG